MSKLKYSLGFILWLSFISYLSLTPSSPVSSPIPGLDKIVHFVFYLVLTWLLGMSIRIEWKINPFFFWVVLISIPICIGVAIELIQSTVPGRTRENLDIVFNVIGTCIGIIPFFKRTD